MHAHASAWDLCLAVFDAQQVAHLSLVALRAK